jgi:hypothetical protein
VGEFQEVWLYSSVHDNIAYIGVQLEHNDRMCFCGDCKNGTAVDGWKKCTKVMTVATEFVQKWCYSGTVSCAVQR